MTGIHHFILFVLLQLDEDKRVPSGLIQVMDEDGLQITTGEETQNHLLLDTQTRSRPRTLMQLLIRLHSHTLD